jgi:diamine N-acetyltransferase
LQGIKTLMLQYQKISLDDIPLMQTVGRATYEPYYHHIWQPGGLDWYMEKCFGVDALAAELLDPNIEYLICREQDGGIVGFLKLLLQKPVPDSPISNALYLEKIYLMPAFFGKGYGQKLMAFVFEKAARQGSEAVWLVCMEHGPVWAYEQAGFQTIGTVQWDFELLKDNQRLGLVMLRDID